MAVKNIEEMYKELKEFHYENSMIEKLIHSHEKISADLIVVLYNIFCIDKDYQRMTPRKKK